jgi:DNA polymerase-3 subunit delta
VSSDLSDLKPIYLIHGQEDLLLEQAVDRLKARFAAVGDLDYNLKTFDGDSADGYEIVAAANTLPFMSERLLVVVRRADRLKTDDLNVIADYAADPNPATSLVLVARKIARNMRVYKAIDALGGVAEYKPPSKREYPKTVVEMFAHHGKRVGIDGAEVLVRAVGLDLRRLDVEIQKVVAFTGEETTLSRDEIEAVMSTTAPTSIFDFLDALGGRDCRRALRLLADLLGEGESIYGVEAMTARHVRSLISVRVLSAREDGAEQSDIAREIAAAPWQVKNYTRQADRFSEGELVDALRNLAQADREMKTSREPRLVFERWIVDTCGS